MSEMHKYSYDGPVTEFEKCIASHWKAETIASSESKARANLKYQFKKQNNKATRCKIDLPGKIVMAD